MKIVYPTWFELQFNDNDGNPLSLGRIYTYKSGVGSLADTYNENDQVNSNPVILNANGRATIRLDSSFAYKFEVRDKNNVLIYERDKVYGSEVGQTEGTNNHDALINRELTNQHPTSAITGLDTALSAITGDVSQLIIDVTNLNENKVNRSGDTMAGALYLETALGVYYDSADQFSPNGKVYLYAGEDSASFYMQEDGSSNVNQINYYVGSADSNATIRHGFQNQIHKYVSDNLVDLLITRDAGNSRFETLLSDDTGVPYARLFLGVTDASLQVTAKGNLVELIHYDGVATDTILLPVVTGETKTLAQLESPSFTGSVNITGSSPVADFVRTSADTNAMRYSSLLTHSTTSDMADGFGVQQAFLIKDNAGVANVIGALGFRRAGADNSGEVIITCIQNGSPLIIADATPVNFNLVPTLKTSASTTTRAGVNLPHGVDPISPVNGDLWTKTTGLFTRINGVTYETAVKSNLGNLQLISLGNTAIGQNTTTNERGHLVRMVNGTGSNSVKGTLISASTTIDNQFVLQANEFDAFGVVAESGIASGQECWIWVNGSTCEVLWENGKSSTRGYVAICAPTDGRALNIAVPSSNPTVGEHFKEIGHVLQSKASGTNVLVLCQIHFN